MKNQRCFKIHSTSVLLSLIEKDKWKTVIQCSVIVDVQWGLNQTDALKLLQRVPFCLQIKSQLPFWAFLCQGCITLTLKMDPKNVV